MYLVTALLMRIGSRTQRPAEPAELAEIIRSRRQPDAAGNTTGPAHLHTVVGPDRVHAALFMEAVDAAAAERAASDFLAGVFADHHASVGWVLAAFGRAEPPDTTEPRGQGPKCRGSAPPCP